MKAKEIRDLIRYLTSLIPRPKRRVPHVPVVSRGPGRSNPPTQFGIDYAWGSPSIHSLKTVGARFVCRYLSRDRSKTIRRLEAKTLRRYGFGIVTVFEDSATRALGGFDSGAADARFCVLALRNAGSPRNAPVFFAVDFDESPAQAEAVRQYFLGVVSILGHNRVGAYGGYWVIKRLFDAGLIRYGWQTYAWSGTNWDFRAQLRQFSNGHTIGGVDCDFDRAMAPDYGQWHYG